MSRKISRRHFIQTSAAAAATLALTDVPLVRAQSANNKLNMAFIGTGGRGGAHIGLGRSENVLAICDCDLTMTANAAKMYPKAKVYQDYRKLFDEVGEQLDAVVIATPDHHHGPASMRALRRNCHVYTEKPMAYTVEEARLMAEEARKRRVATQMGNQGHANHHNRAVVEYVRAGVIGDIQEIHIWTNRPVWPQGMAKRSRKVPVPDHLDWDAWIGPAPFRERHDNLHRFQWRGWLDFGTGAIGDMGAHTMDNVFWAMDPGDTATIECTRADNRNDETYPSRAIYKWEFAATDARPAFALYWYEGGLKPPRPEATKDDRMFKGRDLAASGGLYIGSKGSFYFFGDYCGQPMLIGEKFRRDTLQAIKDKSIKLDRIAPSIGHHREWMEACKGQRKWDYPLASFMYGGPLTETMLLGNVALRVGKKLTWDAKKLRCTDCDEAEQYLKRSYRKGWGLDG
jgi:predicted dehydrogenase